MATRELKARLRAELLARRQALPPATRAAEATRACAALAAHPAWRAARVVALYQAYGAELDLATLRAEAHATGKTVALPRVAGDRLGLHLVTADTPLERSPLGVREPAADAPRLDPAQLDLIVVPGVGFDAHGGRLGHGAGYYDRLLAALPATVKRVGVGYGCQQVAAVPTEDHDIPLHAVVAPTGWVDAGN